MREIMWQSKEPVIGQKLTKNLENTTAYKWDHIGTTYATTEMTTPYYEVGGKVKSFLGLLTVYKMVTK